MGVRLYTMYMLTTTPLSELSLPGTPTVTLDWSNLLQSDGVDAQHLLEWVRGYPRKREIHVYIPQKQRPLQRQLQALGCTVTRTATFA